MTPASSPGRHPDPARVDALREALSRAVGVRRGAEADPAARLTYMEVCGTHTMAVSRYGLRDLLPAGLRLISGPGCPVCVTAVGDLDVVVALSRQPGVTIATFGDLVRVPSSHSSLARERAAGADVRVVYSPADAVELAVAQPARQVVLVGIGFETTAPTVAASLTLAAERGLENLSVVSLHKTMPGALRALLDLGETTIDGFILPGHVSVVTGSDCYRFLPDEYGIGGVVAGFEADDVLEALLMLAGQRRPAVEIGYRRAVTTEGNPAAQRLLADVFEPCDAEWRGLGTIAESGLRLREEWAGFDALRRFAVDPGTPVEPAGCRCGEVLRGVIDPDACPLFGRRCTPETPVGACMVSSEGSCAAHYRYRTIDHGGDRGR
ncbi:MAG TPA: hydrogenase formation protein HypD [Thermoleophilia bacterium]|nr:hydrogenase formation protein HypD [Thermoleophilia bacterium]